MTSILALAISTFAALSPIKVHVDGDGYMRFIRDGRVVYAKQATLENIGGQLGADGAKLLPGITIPDSATSISIDLMGNVDAGSSHLGRLVLGIFPAGSTSSGIGSFISFSDQATLTSPGEDTAGVIRVDSGTNSAAAQISDPIPAKIQAQKPTPKSLKISIAGNGFFKLVSPTGAAWYTRDGALRISPTGAITSSQGFLLEPNITVPQGSTNISVSATGVVTVMQAGQTEPTTIGQLILFGFANPNGLVLLDPNLYAEGPHSGEVRASEPGQGGLGLVKFNGSLHGDASNIAVAHTSIPNTAATKTTNNKPTPASTTSGAQVEILVRQHTDITGKNFSVGDIATITGPDDLVTAYKKVQIGATAPAGTNRVIDQHYVILKLMGAGFHPGSYALIVPDGADVARKTVTVSADDIVAAAVKAAQDKTGMKIPFKAVEAVLPIVAEEGEVSVEASEPVLTNKNYHVVVTVRQGTTIVSTRTVNLAPPENLGSIKAGDAISIVFKSGSAEIEVQGKAVTQGFVGQKIQVSIAGVGVKATTQTGTVIDTGKVEVDL